MRRVDGLDDLRVRVAQRVGRPAVLKVNVAPAVHIPYEITKSAIYYDLIGTAESAPAGSCQFLVEFETVAEQGDAAREHFERFGSWELSWHAYLFRKFN